MVSGSLGGKVPWWMGFVGIVYMEGHTRLIGGIGGVLVDKGFAIGGAVMPDNASPNKDVNTSHTYATVLQPHRNRRKRPMTELETEA